MRRVFLLIASILLITLVQAQIVRLEPSGAGADEALSLIFDATQGNAELAAASKVYVHHGVVTDSENGTDWQYVVGNWGADDGVGQMSPVDGQPGKWKVDFEPTLRQYFKVPSGENIFRISAVFRSADGNTKGTIAPGKYGWGDVTSSGDFYINLNVNAYVTITSPVAGETYLDIGEGFAIEAVASSNVSKMSVWLNEGDGYNEKKSVSSGQSIAYTYIPSQTIMLGIKVEATINGKLYTEEKQHQLVVKSPNTIAELPAGVVAGINYHPTDLSKVTLALEAPGKEYAYVVGDFSNWEVNENFKMNQTSDGEYFWIEIDELETQKPYVFQYWIDGAVKVGDPYADWVADPWNDTEIDESIFPGIPEYTKTEYGIATVLKTGQENYLWSEHEASWQSPNVDHLVIYELHVRDFLASHSYTDLIDTLTYLKKLGVDAIELMPVNEFEGNKSWGYNPSYYFAPDKYYGTKNELKRFIDHAHQNGMAVIVDMVLNHAFGQNAMVQMYWDEVNKRPAANNPWFNVNHAGQYQWGYDFNHESEYTQRFIDRVNKYWLEEFGFDGFRFDFTKGFTNYAPGGSVDGFDQSRIDILKRMADEIWKSDANAYIILEHWGTSTEEAVLANYGMKMWRNRSYDFVPAVTGAATGSFANMSATSHVSYFNSHDERRIAEHALTEGLAMGNYNVKNPLIMFERVKMAAAFAYLNPGPKMIWQFDELGYDISIDYNGRTGEKPLPWGNKSLDYYPNSDRQNIYKAYRAILDLRKSIGPEMLLTATTNHKLSGTTRRLVYDTPQTDLVLIANFGLETAAIDPAFTQTGTWFNYFTGEEINVGNASQSFELRAGEWHIFTNVRLSEGLSGVVEVFDMPVSVSPFPFSMKDEITITFDASKAWPDGTNGLNYSTLVNLNAGYITDEPFSLNIKNEKSVVMAQNESGLWEVKLKPSVFFNTTAAMQLVFYFTDNEGNRGMGFRNKPVYFDVLSEKPIVTISPASFEATDPITITFDATQGNRELMGADKVYMHSSAVTQNTKTPQTTTWSYAIGNWGLDDGIGLMTQVAENIWEITLEPRSYYQLPENEHPYWIAAVFRNANGTVKGTTAPGALDNGLVAANLDFFIQNQKGLSASNSELQAPIVYPNPSSGFVHFKNSGGEFLLKVFNKCGMLVLKQQVDGCETIDLSDLPNGIYIYNIEDRTGIFNGKIVKW